MCPSSLVHLEHVQTSFDAVCLVQILSAGVSQLMTRIDFRFNVVVRSTTQCSISIDKRDDILKYIYKIIFMIYNF